MLGIVAIGGIAYNDIQEQNREIRKRLDDLETSISSKVSKSSFNNIKTTLDDFSLSLRTLKRNQNSIFEQIAYLNSTEIGDLANLTNMVVNLNMTVNDFDTRLTATGKLLLRSGPQKIAVVPRSESCTIRDGMLQKVLGAF